MSGIVRPLSFVLAGLFCAAAPLATAQAKDKVKVGFIGPLTGGVSVNGIGGRNSAELAVKLRNADAKAKYEYELVVLDDECKPNVAGSGGPQKGGPQGIHPRGPPSFFAARRPPA